MGDYPTGFDFGSDRGERDRLVRRVYRSLVDRVAPLVGQLPLGEERAIVEWKARGLLGDVDVDFGHHIVPMEVDPERATAGAMS